MVHIQVLQRRLLRIRNLFFTIFLLSLSLHRRRGRGQERDIILVTTAWVPDERHSPHLSEVKASIALNSANKYISQIHVVLEGSNSQYNCTHFRSDIFPTTMWYERFNSKIHCIRWPARQPTYFEMFNHTKHVAPVEESVVILANADMVFDSTIGHLKNIDEKAFVVIATRGLSSRWTPWKIVKAYSEMTGYRFVDVVNRCYTDPSEKRTSWDAYAFVPSLLQLSQDDFMDRRTNDMFPMNQNGAENAALAAISRLSRFQQYAQICDHVHMWHFHTKSKMHSTHLGVKHDQLTPDSCPLLQRCLVPSGITAVFRSVNELT